MIIGCMMPPVLRVAGASAWVAGSPAGSAGRPGRLWQLLRWLPRSAGEPRTPPPARSWPARRTPGRLVGTRSAGRRAGARLCAPPRVVLGGKLLRHDPAGRFSGLGSAYTAAPGNWAPASRPVRGTGGGYAGAETRGGAEVKTARW